MPAVIWLFVNATVNRHSHLLAGGYIITHAHPFDRIPADQGPYKSHDHSEKGLFFLSLISDPAAPLATIAVFSFLCALTRRIFKMNLYYPLPFKEYYQVHNYHAPPFPA